MLVGQQQSQVLNSADVLISGISKHYTYAKEQTENTEWEKTLNSSVNNRPPVNLFVSFKHFLLK